jgi:hypothetical protein
MDLSFIQPQQELRPYIKSFWACESAVGMPATDRSLAAPNGCPKLIVPYENSLESIANGRLQVSHEQGLYFVENRDSSTLIRSSLRKTGFIGIEFSPHGAFPVLLGNGSGKRSTARCSTSTNRDQSAPPFPSSRPSRSEA